MLWIRERFGGTLKRDGGKCMCLIWRGSSALPVLRAMLPYLVFKKAQAELAIEWIGLLTTSDEPALSHAESQRRYKARLRGEQVSARAGWRTSPAAKARRLEIVRELGESKRVG